MARKACMIQTSIWHPDNTFRHLAPDAKLTYLMLLTQPDITTLGCLPMVFKRWSKQLRLTPRRLVFALAALGEHGYTWDDPETEEIIIRTWIKHNVLGSPQMMKAAIDQLPALASTRLRNHLLSEYPSLFGDPIETVSRPYRDGIETVSEDRGKRGVRLVVSSSSKDLEGENHSEDNPDDPLVLRLLGVMGEHENGQAHLELRGWRGRGASDHDIVEVIGAMEKTRVRSPRSYVNKALSKRLKERAAS